jgi:hypothetical protein
LPKSRQSRKSRTLTDLMLKAIYLRKVNKATARF